MFSSTISKCRSLVEAGLSGVPALHQKAVLDVMGNGDRVGALKRALQKKVSQERGAQADYQNKMTPGKRLMRKVLRRPEPQRPTPVTRSVSSYTATAGGRMEGLITRLRGLLQTEAYGGGAIKPYRRELGPEGKRFAKKAVTRIGRQQARSSAIQADPDGPNRGNNGAWDDRDHPIADPTPNVPRRATKGRQYPRGFSPPALQSSWKTGLPPKKF